MGNDTLLRPCPEIWFIMSPLRRLAWLNVFTHIAGLILAALFLSKATPLVSLESRLRFLTETPGAWRATWCVWVACAAALLVFLGRIALRELAGSGLAQVGLMFAITAFGFDLTCDTLYIAVFPDLAANSSDRNLFLLVERVTGIVSLTIANGFYTIGVVCVSEAIPSDRAIRGTRPLGWCVGLFGAWMAAAGVTGDPWHAVAATGPTIFTFCAWTLLAARSLAPREKRA
jgi:hypothetical protein